MGVAVDKICCGASVKSFKPGTWLSWSNVNSSKYKSLNLEAQCVPERSDLWFLLYF